MDFLWYFLADIFICLTLFSGVMISITRSKVTCKNSDELEAVISGLSACTMMCGILAIGCLSLSFHVKPGKVSVSTPASDSLESMLRDI
jgi:hypothetical protein